jgi:predicted double-glycine peptidase
MKPFHAAVVTLVIIFSSCKLYSGANEGVSSTKDDPAVAKPGTLRWLYDNGQKPGGAVRFIPTPLVAQSRSFTCGLASLQSVLAYWGEFFRESQLQKFLGTHPIHGTSYRAMIEFLHDLNDPAKLDAFHDALGDEEVKEPGEEDDRSPTTGSENTSNEPLQIETFEGKSTEMRPVSDTVEEGVPVDGLTIKELAASIDAGKPVIVLVQAWSDDEHPDYRDNWKDGHFVVALGYDAEKFYFMDPSTWGNYVQVPRSEFLVRWHDTDERIIDGRADTVKVRHFGLIVSRKKAVFDPEALPKMD